MVIKLQDQLSRKTVTSSSSGGPLYNAHSLDVKGKILDLGINSNVDLNTVAGQTRASLEWKAQLEKGY